MALRKPSLADHRLLLLLLLLLLPAALVEGTASTVQVHWPTGREDAFVITSDEVGQGRSGAFAHLAVDDPAHPRFAWAADTSRNVIRRKDYSTGVWQLVAGLDGKAGARDGAPGTSLLDRPTSICVNPAGDLIVADSGNACIRSLSPDGTLSTLAGICGSTGGRDGPGNSALFSGSLQSIVCLSNCSVLVADEPNGKVRTVLVHDHACEAAARKARAHHYTAGALWLTAIVVAGVALLAAAAGIVAAQRYGYVELHRRPSSAVEQGYGQLDYAAAEPEGEGGP